MADFPHSPLPRVSFRLLLPLVFLTVAGLTVAWLLRASRAENAALKAELTTLRLAWRAAASRENLAADALGRVARLEEALTVMRREPAESGEDRAEELERVIVFLREEIKAAHETIERLKQEDPAGKSARR